MAKSSNSSFWIMRSPVWTLTSESGAQHAVAAAADKAEAERRAKELAAERERMTTASRAEAAEPEAVAPELPAAASDDFARIDCDSPRVVLGGESELSARIDALFRVKRSPALAAQLNKIYEKHDGIPRYTT